MTFGGASGTLTPASVANSTQTMDVNLDGVRGEVLCRPEHVAFEHAVRHDLATAL